MGNVINRPPSEKAPMVRMVTSLIFKGIEWVCLQKAPGLLTPQGLVDLVPYTYQPISTDSVSSLTVIEFQATSKGSDQTMRMHRLVCAFADGTYHFVGNLISRLIFILTSSGSMPIRHCSVKPRSWVLQ